MAPTTGAYVIVDSDDEPEPPRVARTAPSDPARRSANDFELPPVPRGNNAERRDEDLLQQQLLETEHKLDILTEQIEKLNAERSKLLLVKQSIQSQLIASKDAAEAAERNHFREANRRIDWKSPTAFAWSEQLPNFASHFFKLDGFRPGQLEAINATLSHRDVFMIAATGHGKSLTYQLPALLHDSFTLVVSPLLSLSRDQVLGLQEKGIKAAMIYAGTPKDEEKRILEEMLYGDNPPQSKSAKVPLGAGCRPQAPPDYADYLQSLAEDEEPYAEGSLRLIYVTPEKLSKSKRFVSHLEKCYARGRIARIVVDEAHCVSQLSHDFRPDYKKLGLLKQLFPNIPLLALSATCPPELVASCFSILGLRSIETDPRRGSLVLTTDLYRPNLHYSVLQKSSSAEGQVDEIAEWIQANHANDTGIVYTLSRKDAEVMAVGLQSKGIKAGVYHAECDPADRDRVHQQWRTKKLKVVCATIAFGLGIDLPDVRYVLHSSLAKSVEGYYQESGRAGRDGKDSDCVLFYRASDYSRLSAMAAGDAEGRRGVLGMLKYCEDMLTCRRTLMERYFGREQQRPGSASQKCGHCDNCQRDPGTVVRTDVTKHVVSVCSILDGIKTGSSKAKGDKLTLLKLVDVWRGNGLNKLSADIAALVPSEAKKELTKLQMEKIAVACVIEGLIEEEISFTAYSTISYLRTTDRGRRLVRMFKGNPNDIQNRIHVAFEKEGEAPRKRKRSSVGGASDKEKPVAVKPGKSDKGKGKAKAAAVEEAILVDDDSEPEFDPEFEPAEAAFRYEDYAEEMEDEEEVFPAKRRKQSYVVASEDEVDDDDDLLDDY